MFYGNGYDESWIREAESRGLLNLKSTPDALSHMLDAKNIALFTSHRVLSEAELRARHEVQLENYCKVLHIEALTMLDMARHDILPAASAFAGTLSRDAAAKRALDPALDCTYELQSVTQLSTLTSQMYQHAAALEDALSDAAQAQNLCDAARLYHDNVLFSMNALRQSADALERMTDARLWPFPTYGEILFSIR